MIGKAYVSVTPFYDSRKKKKDFKKRPVLVVGQADVNDYIVLPISKISISANINSYYDVPMEIADYPLMKLQYKSYIRTHKQTVIHGAELVHEITDFRNSYPDTYLDVMIKVEEFQKQLVEKAI